MARCIEDRRRGRSERAQLREGKEELFREVWCRTTRWLPGRGGGGGERAGNSKATKKKEHRGPRRKKREKKGHAKDLRLGGCQAEYGGV